ncbi:MAG: hypothetical protein MUE36_03005 [Acidimicrobiales bacterium]|jgi:hypothetical protein|nr:hypothetical protein [Acidimicrobiales bacterium]
MRRSLLPALVVVVALTVASGCSDGDGTDSAVPTTGAGTGTTLAGSPGEEAPATTGSSVPGPPSPSVLPPPSTEPGAPPSAASCDALRRALPVADLLPRDLDSWPDERQRVVVDARLNAALYDQAAAAGPESLRGPLADLSDFANFVADETQAAPDAASARATIDGYPRQAEVAAATVEVERWVRVECP